MPEWLSVVFAVLTVTMTVLVWVRGHKRIAGRLILSALNFIVILFVLFATYCNPYWNSISFRINADYYSRDYTCTLSSGEAVQDINYAVKYLQKLHPALKDGLTR